MSTLMFFKRADLHKSKRKNAAARHAFPGVIVVLLITFLLYINVITVSYYL